MGGTAVTARTVLNRLKWDPGAGGLGGVLVIIRHVGAPGDEKAIPAETITGLGKGSFECPAGIIPYHRVLRIYRGDSAIFTRRRTDPRVEKG